MKRAPGHRSTVARSGPPTRPSIPRPRSTPRPAGTAGQASSRHPHGLRSRPPKREVARIVDDGERSLVDVLDSLLNQGVVLNADLVLALADVDLVYVRLSALLVAADRILPRQAE